MEPLTLDALDEEAEQFDARVAESRDIDRFCSSTDWVLPAALALQAGRAPWLRRGEHGYVALAQANQPGLVLEPLEAMWGLACPLVGADAQGLARELAAELRASRVRPDALVLCGLQPRASRLRAVAEALAPLYRLGLGPTSLRYCASLDGGLDGFLGRRSPKLRASLRHAERRARAHGLSFERVELGENGDGAVEAAYARLLAVEAQSWKGVSGVGFAHSEMLGFYRVMLPRLARRRAVRLLFARHDGRDVAYVLGGVRDGIYRGLQFSYVEGWERFSLGNLCQLEMIALLASEGVAVYDLGAEVEYKRRWGEIEFATVTLIAIR